jgi:uncharacterized protein (TIGR02246 family)
MKSLLAALASALLSCLTLAQGDAPSAPSDEAAKTARSLEDAYVAAFDKGDVQTLGNLYGEDVQFTANDGAVTSGRAAVVEGLTKYFAKNKDAKLDVTPERARLLTPEVLTEQGVSAVTTPQEGTELTRYTLTYVKKGSQWLIAQIEESALPGPDAAAQTLSELGWLVGNWKDNAPGMTVETKSAWTKNGHFLRRSFTITHEGGNTVTATEIIGYDPVASRLRSWIFDSEGGFGEGMWRQDGNKWLASVKATGPDGSQSTAQHIITKVDDNKYTWESINRTRNGEVLPNLDRVEVVREP